METIITVQLLTFLKTNNLLSDHQYGFRKARSTGDPLAYAVHVWSSALESCGESRVISLDISKAFGRVWHKGLLAKLPMFGLHHTLINWIGSFLSDRSIAVRVGGFLSNLHSINAGVPQGSFIFPVLFILFINDLLTSTSSSIHSFADDMMDTSASFTQLGLPLSSNLTWKTHIHSLAKHASQKLGFLARACRFFSSSHILSIYKSQMRPSLEYCSHVWGGAPKSTLFLLDKVQSKAICLINNPNLTKSLQPLSRRRLVGDLYVYYRFFNGHCSQEIREIILAPLRRVRTTRSSTHSHRFQVSLPTSRTLSHKSSFIPRTCNLWNLLPSCFPESYNLPSFKSKINSLDLISLSSLPFDLFFLLLLGLCIGHHGLSSTQLTN